MDIGERIENNIQTLNPPSGTHRRALQWIVLAAVFLLFANGRNTIPVAAWLAPVFLLRYVRLRRAWPGLMIAWLVLSATWAFQFRGMAPLPGIWYYVLGAIYGLVLVLPFIMDKILAPRLGGFAATFVLPTTWVGMEFLVAKFAPYGSWGSAAYSQYENLILLQVVSLTGLYGISFLIAWVAAVGNWAWEKDFSWHEVRVGVLGFTAVMTVIWVFGCLRLALFPSNVQTVRVASLTRPDIDLFPSEEFAHRAFGGTLTGDEIQEVRRRAELINLDLLRRAEKEAQAGAKIIFWGETNSFAFKEDEQALIDRGSVLARKNQIYLGIAVGTWNRENPKPLENKLVLLDPQGNRIWENWKLRPVPGPEAAVSALNDGRIKSAATPHGRLGGVICFDMDFPDLLKQAGRQNVDMMLVPSNDWREIDPWHTHMARFRAIEQGFNIVRHTSGGLSLAADFQGRVLSSMDHYMATDRALISQVPTRGVRTLYSRIGDVFAWLCIGGLLASSVVVRMQRKVVKQIH